MIRKGPFPEIRIEDHVAKFRHPQIEIISLGEPNEFNNEKQDLAEK